MCGLERRAPTTNASEGVLRDGWPVRLGRDHAHEPQVPAAGVGPRRCSLVLPGRCLDQVRAANVSMKPAPFTSL